MTLKTIFALLLILVFTMGCGQNGPLYLPGDASSIQISTPAQAPAEQSDEDDEKDDDDRK